MNAVVLAAILVICAATFGSSGYVPIAPFLASRKGVGALLSAQGFASCIALVPAGRAVDRWGSERVLKPGMVAFLLSLAFTSVSTSFGFQLLGRIGNGASGSMMFCSGMALVMERFRDPLRSEYIGTSIGVGTIGNVLGPPAVGYIYSLAVTSNFEEPQALAIAPCAFLIMLAYVALLRIPEVSSSPRELLLEEQRSHTSNKSILVRFFGVYAAVGVQSWVISIALAVLFGAQTALLCAGAVEMHAHGFSTQVIGLIPVPASILQMVCAHWGGKMSGQPRRRTAIMILSPLALAASLLCCSTFARFYPAGGIMLPIVIAVGAGSAAMSFADAPSISMMSDLAVMHGRGYGEAMTASELAVTAGQAIGPSLGVLTLNRGGFDYVCLTLAAGAIFVSIACAAFLRHVEHVEHAPSSTT